MKTLDAAVDSLDKNHIWNIVPKPEKKVRGSTRISGFKARLVALGILSIDYKFFKKWL